MVVIRAFIAAEPCITVYPGKTFMGPYFHMGIYPFHVRRKFINKAIKQTLDCFHISVMFLVKIVRVIMKFQINKEADRIFGKTGKHFYPSRKLNGDNAWLHPAQFYAERIGLAHSDIESHMLYFFTFSALIYNRIGQTIQLYVCLQYFPCFN